MPYGYTNAAMYLRHTIWYSLAGIVAIYLLPPVPLQLVPQLHVAQVGIHLGGTRIDMAERFLGSQDF
jgi:uncharacterized membrane protein YccC